MPVEEVSEPTVPVLTITGDWTVDDVETLEDCDDAFAALTEAISSIEAQLEGAERDGLLQTDRFIKARHALRFKKAALQVIQWKRGRFNAARREALQQTDDRRLIEAMVRLYPAEFRTCAVAAGISHHLKEVAE